MFKKSNLYSRPENDDTLSEMKNLLSGLSRLAILGECEDRSRENITLKHKEKKKKNKPEITELSGRTVQDTNDLLY